MCTDNGWSASHNSFVVAVVVTYNRKDLLQQCLQALCDQSHTCDILIVDNASNDGTCQMLEADGWSSRFNIHHYRLQENLGGAGGFQHGLSFAMKKEWQWFWLMDDDALPEKDALKNLLKYATQEKNIYGSVALSPIDYNNPNQLSWPIGVVGDHRLINTIDQMEAVASVEALPFLGFLVHRCLVDRIGLPDGTFFISADDLEYSLRARKQGARLYFIRSSRIRHPVASTIIYKLAGHRFVCRILPTWKIYYEVRNKIAIGRRYHGWQVWTKTIPGILLRALLGMQSVSSRSAVIKMNLIGIRDGIMGRMGKRILP